MTSDSNTHNAIHWKRDDDGVVILTIDDPGASVNTMNDAYTESMAASVERLEAERADDHRGDRRRRREELLRRRRPQPPAQLQSLARGRTDGPHRARQGPPAPARSSAGRWSPPSTAPRSAAASRSPWPRITASSPTCRAAGIGQPEVTLGLLPGRRHHRIVRMLGLQKALTQVILPGTKFKPARGASSSGWSTRWCRRCRFGSSRKPRRGSPRTGGGQAVGQEGLRDPRRRRGRARRWRASCRRWRPTCASRSRARRCRRRELRPRGGGRGLLSTSSTASLIETRYLVSLTTGQVAKNMIGAFFFDLQKIDAGASDRRGSPSSRPGRSG